MRFVINAAATQALQCWCLRAGNSFLRSLYCLCESGEMPLSARSTSRPARATSHEPAASNKSTSKQAKQRMPLFLLSELDALRRDSSKGRGLFHR